MICCGRFLMLIRIKGGSGGIKEYLEDGQKKDRFYSRDQLDERLILSGDLVITDNIISDIDGDNKYFHITLAFKEDHLSTEMLQNIDSEFQEFFFNAYDSSEMNYYSEAHLPRIKSYEDATGNIVERKPHIHIVIPRINLVTDNKINPSIPDIKTYINAFQETINNKYGLQSPKDNTRSTFNNSSEIISRIKGDDFQGANKEAKADVLKLILDKSPNSTQELSSLLANLGYETKVRNSGKDNEYLNIRLPEMAKGINLKESVFSNDFLALTKQEKFAKINRDNLVKYHEPMIPKQSNDTYESQLHDWYNYKSLESRYYSNFSDKQRNEYKQLTNDERKTYINEFHNNYQKENVYGTEREIRHDYRLHDVIQQSNERKSESVEYSVGRITSFEIGDNTARIRESIARRNQAGYGKYSDNIAITGPENKINSGVQQLQNDAKNLKNEVSYSQTIKEFNSKIKAEIMIELLAKSHGLNPNIYSVVKDNNGYDRIQCGSRKLSVVDFCLKEMHFNFKQTNLLLNNALVLQNDIYQKTGWTYSNDRYLASEYREWLKDFKKEHSQLFLDKKNQYQDERKSLIDAYKTNLAAIKDDNALKYYDKISQINLLKMEHTISLANNTNDKNTSLNNLRSDINERMSKSYNIFLSEQASIGDEIALEELRKLKYIFNEQNSINGKEQNKFRFDFSYTIDENGYINYKINDEIVIKDIGSKIEVLKSDDDYIKLSLDLAVRKFGHEINLTGTDDFKISVIEYAINNNLNVSFIDEFSKHYSEKYHEQIENNTKIIEDSNVQINDLLNDKDHLIIKVIDHDSKNIIINDKVCNVEIFNVIDQVSGNEYSLNSKQLEYYLEHNELSNEFTMQLHGNKLDVRMSKNSEIEKSLKESIINEDLNNFRNELLDTSYSQNIISGVLIKSGEAKNGNQYAILQTSEGRKNIYADNIQNELSNISIGSVVAVAQGGITEIERTKPVKVFEIAKSDINIDQITNDIRNKFQTQILGSNLVSESIGQVVSNKEIITKAGVQLHNLKIKDINGNIKSFYSKDKFNAKLNAHVYLRQGIRQKYEINEIAAHDIKYDEGCARVSKVGIIQIRGKDVFYAEFKSGDNCFKKYGNEIRKQIDNNKIKPNDTVKITEKVIDKKYIETKPAIKVKQLDYKLPERIKERSGKSGIEM